MRVNGRGPTRAGTLQLDPAQGKDRKFLEEMFCCYDPNGDGTGSLRPKDFASLCKAVGLRLKKAEVKALMRQLDLNGNGEIELHEFALFFNRATTRAELKRTVKEVGGSKNAYVRKLFEEFKHPRLPGVDEDGLLELANIAQVDLDERELRLFFRRLDARANLGFISQDDLLLFMTNVEERPKLLEHLETAGRGNKLFLREVYDAFDTSRGGNMSELDLLSAARFLGVQISEKGLGDMLARIDTNRDGTVSIDEFMDFFSQVSSTEELMEALQDFGAAKARSRYVLAFSALLGMALCAVGLGLSYAPDQSEDGVALGIAFTILGLCVLLLVLAQTFLEAFIMDVVLPALMKWNLTKVLKVGTAFVTLGCAMLILGVLGFVRGPLAGFGAIMFILPVVVAVLCGPFYYFFLKVGWLEPVPDIDSPLPQVRKSGPPSARAAFEAEEATAAP
jgi:Ca2+-binding EF-hand superfamily protein